MGPRLLADSIKSRAGGSTKEKGKKIKTLGNLQGSDSAEAGASGIFLSPAFGQKHPPANRARCEPEWQSALGG